MSDPTPAPNDPTTPDPPEPPSERPQRKDRLIQTRVPRKLEETLKEEARRRRLTVSHLIRNILEDTLDLVDDVVADVDQIVSDSFDLARNVGRNARRLASPDRKPRARATRSEADESPDPDGAAPDGPDASAADLAHVLAWNEVVLHRAVTCSQCGAELLRGQRGYAGLGEEPGPPRAWLCQACIDAL